MRRHPCEVQFGKCKYGSSCKYADLPGDTCLRYLRGGCAYGAECYLAHDFHGVDLLEIFPENLEEIRVDIKGTKYRIPKKNAPDSPEEDEFEEVRPPVFAALPKPPLASRYASTVRAAPIQKNSASRPIEVKPEVRTVAKHPCIVQLGACKYGARCAHKNIDGDVCVFWLNQNCRNKKCGYRHSKDRG